MDPYHPRMKNPGPKKGEEKGTESPRFPVVTENGAFDPVSSPGFVSAESVCEYMRSNALGVFPSKGGLHENCPKISMERSL
jgi:hypothetical protein